MAKTPASPALYDIALARAKNRNAARGEADEMLLVITERIDRAAEELKDPIVAMLIQELGHLQSRLRTKGGP